MASITHRPAGSALLIAGLVLAAPPPLDAQPSAPPAPWPGDAQPQPVPAPMDAPLPQAPPAAPTRPAPPQVPEAPTAAGLPVIAAPPAASPAAGGPAARRDPGRDAHADRVVLMSTAYTHPKGTLYLSNYDIVLFQAGYAVTDETQISLTLTPPFPPYGTTPLDLTLKTALVRQTRVRVAATGSVTGVILLENTSLLVGRVGGVTQLCIEADCRSSISVGANLVMAGPVMLMMNGVGLILPLGRSVTLLVELDTVLPIGAEAGDWNGASLSAGVRFPSTRWAIDLALVRPLDTVREPAAFPVVAATYRFAR